MLPKYVRKKVAKGRTYLYFDTGKKVDGKPVLARLPDLRSPDFGQSYAALIGHRNRTGGGEVLTLPQLVDRFERSAAWRSLTDSSRKRYSVYFRQLEKLLPTAPVALLETSDMQQIYDKAAGAGRLGAADGLVTTASLLFGWGKPRGLVKGNPCAGVQKEKGGEHEPWSDSLLSEALSTSEASVRLLTHLLYFTGQRLSDVCGLAWTDLDGEYVRVRQQKTGKALTIRLHRELRAELATRPRDGVVVCTAEGKAITPASARYRLQTFAAKRGGHVVPHGLRKNAVIALLEAGNSVAETAAISGQSYRMVEHYAKQIDQKRLADGAILRWERNGKGETK